MSFCTAINCMDGRTQLPVNEYLRQSLGVDYCDTITEPGPVRVLAEEPDSLASRSILERIDISVTKHGSRCLAVIGHWDCAGNPAPKERQCAQLEAVVRLLSDRYPDARILGLWVDSNWSVSQICAAGKQ
jgi:hypothetical protein